MSASAPPSSSRDPADAPLRRDVRRLGDVLGRTLVEQEGHELLEEVERIRLLSRDARATGRASRREELRRTVAGLEPERQALVLRAFGVYFQLANLAEQHHRLRRRRQYEHERRVPRESLADAFTRLRRAGVEPSALESVSRRLSLELVLTAHPPRRRDAACWRPISAWADSSPSSTIRPSLRPAEGGSKRRWRRR